MELISKLDFASKVNVIAVGAALAFIAAIVAGLF
jgi:hypothetical protein